MSVKKNPVRLAGVGLMIVLLTAWPSPVGAQAAGTLEVSDPKGDVRPASAQPSPIGLPQSALTDAQDLVALRVKPVDEEAIQVELQLADLKSPLANVDGGIFARQVFQVVFEAPRLGVTYALRWEILFAGAITPREGHAPIWLRFCLHESGGPCVQQEALGRVDWEASAFTAWLPRDSLLGRRPLVSPSSPSQASAPVLDAQGSLELSGFVGQTLAGAPLGLVDRIPDAGATGAVVVDVAAATAPRASLDVPSLYSRQANWLAGGAVSLTHPVVPVPSGTPTAVRVRIHNPADEERSIGLSFRLAETETRSSWSPQLLPSVLVPAGQSRVVNLIVPPSSAAFNTQQPVQVLARHGTETGALSMLLVAAAAPPGPQARELHFHASGSANPYNAFIQPAFCSLPVCINAGGWMNTVVDDPRGNLDHGLALYASLRYQFPPDHVSGSTLRFRMEYAAPADLVFDPSAPLRLRIAIRSELPLTGGLTAHLLSDERRLAGATTVYEVTGRGNVDLSLIYEDPSERVGAGAPLDLLLDWRHSPASAHLVANTVKPPIVILRESFLSLPIIKDPTPKHYPLAAGPAVVTLSTDAPEHQFLNPGDQDVVNLTILNEGIQEDVVRILVESSDRNWSHQVWPATESKLASGASAVASLLLTAPRDASEGLQATFTVTAVSKTDDRARSQVVLWRQVTTGADVSEHPAAKAIGVVAEERGSRSPAPGPLMILATVVVGVWLLRRGL